MVDKRRERCRGQGKAQFVGEAGRKQDGLLSVKFEVIIQRKRGVQQTRIKFEILQPSCREKSLLRAYRGDAGRRLVAERCVGSCEPLPLLRLELGSRLGPKSGIIKLDELRTNRRRDFPSSRVGASESSDIDFQRNER